MSAPTASVLLAKHVGEMLKQISEDLTRHGYERDYGSRGGVRARIEWSSDTTEPFQVYLDEGFNTFHGAGNDAGSALLTANSARQAHHEKTIAAAERQEDLKRAALELRTGFREEDFA